MLWDFLKIIKFSHLRDPQCLQAFEAPLMYTWTSDSFCNRVEHDKFLAVVFILDMI